MTERDKGSEDSNADKRLEDIKKEEKEDASIYYSQDDSHDDDMTNADYENPIQSLDPKTEEMSFLKTVAFLGFGLATLAIVFILFFIRDLDERVLSADKKVDSTASTVAKLDEEIGPFKEEVSQKFKTVNVNLNKLKGEIGNYERMMAVMELKRALITIQEVMGGSDSSIKLKSSEVVGSIQSLLHELGDKNKALLTPLPSSSKNQSLNIEKPIDDSPSIEEDPGENNSEGESESTSFKEIEDDEENSSDEESDLDQEDINDEESEEDEEDSIEEISSSQGKGIGENNTGKIETMEKTENILTNDENDNGSITNTRKNVQLLNAPTEERVGEISLTEDSEDVEEKEEQLPPIEVLLKENP